MFVTIYHNYHAYTYKAERWHMYPYSGIIFHANLSAIAGTYLKQIFQCIDIIAPSIPLLTPNHWVTVLNLLLLSFTPCNPVPASIQTLV